ncbi:MAG: hypothetical protein V1820_04435 [archaeon]
MASKKDASAPVSPPAAPTLAEMDFNPAGNFSDEAPPGTDTGSGGPSGPVGIGGPAVVKFLDEIDLRAIIADLEKTKAEISALKEIKFNADARIKELSEGIGELRSMSLQRDQSTREVEAKVSKMEEIVKNVQPQIILAELQKREHELEATRAQLERTTMMLNETISQVRDIQKSMERVRGITNILDVDKGLNSKIGKLESQLALGERFSTKAEKLYYEIDKRMTDFAVMREKLERIDALTKEIMREFDEKKIKLGAAASVDEFNLFKREVEEKLNTLRETLERRVASSAAPQKNGNDFGKMTSISSPTTKENPVVEKPFSTETERRETASANVPELLKQRDEIKSMLALLEEEYREGEITEKAFEEARRNSETRLAETEKQIAEASSLPATPARTIPGSPPEPNREPLQETIAQTAPPISPSKLPAENSSELRPPATLFSTLPPEPEGKHSNKSKIPPEKGPEELERIIEIITNLPALHAQERDLERMLSILSRQYKGGVINEETYYEIRRKSEEKLGELRAKLLVIENLHTEQKLFKEEIHRLKRNKAELVSLLALLDKQRGEGLVSEESYSSAKTNASAKLGEIDKRTELLEKIVEKHIDAPHREKPPAEKKAHHTKDKKG